MSNKKGAADRLPLWTGITETGGARALKILVPNVVEKVFYFFRFVPKWYTIVDHLIPARASCAWGVST